jgi:hypothetical protein
MYADTHLPVLLAVVPWVWADVYAQKTRAEFCLQAIPAMARAYG